MSRLTLPILLIAAACQPGTTTDPDGFGVLASTPFDPVAPAARVPVLCATPEAAHLAWMSDTSPFVSTSYDGGRTWTRSAILSTGDAVGAPLSIACQADSVAIGWRGDLGRVPWVVRSDNAGDSWTAAGRLSATGIGQVSAPAFAHSATGIHAAWDDGDGGVTTSHFTYASQTWSFATPLSTGGSASGARVAATPEGVVSVVWEDREDTTATLVVRSSDDPSTASSWSPALRLDAPDGGALRGEVQLAASSLGLAIAWTDSGAAAGARAVTTVLTDPLSDTAPTVVPPSWSDTDVSRDPRVAWRGTRLVAAWIDETYGSPALHTATSEDRGTTWTDATVHLPEDPSPFAAGPPHLAVQGDLIAVAWEERGADGLPGREDVWVVVSTDGGDSWQAPWRADTDALHASASTSPGLIVDDNEGTVAVVWQETETGESRLEIHIEAIER